MEKAPFCHKMLYVVEASGYSMLYAERLFPQSPEACAFRISERTVRQLCCCARASRRTNLRSVPGWALNESLLTGRVIHRSR